MEAAIGRQPIGVVGVPESLGQALAAVVEPAFEPSALDSHEVLAWALAHPGAMLLAPVDLVIDLGLRASGLQVIAVVAEDDPSLYRAALRAGAAACLTEAASDADVSDVVDALGRRQVLLPLSVARRIATASRATDSAPSLRDDDVVVLRGLCEGRPIVSLALEMHRSERDFYRLLRRLYDRLGVCTRVEAVAAAARWGILDDDWAEDARPHESS
jgi:DNA-binding NarL/FixJ family response regulator